MADTLGKYELLKILGKGAMGVVYEGYDPIIHRRLAIKTVKLPDPDDTEARGELARFKREAQASGRLSHPNIVGVFDYGETSEIAYIVMEFVDGTTLKQIMDRKERFELTEIVRIMEGLLTGLQYSHERGVVHRDIKPANIMMTSTGEVKIADFGIARIESSSLTQAGTMMGTPSYMSPEQFMGQTVDARTDIYSSGVMLYQLLTGEKPFDGGLTAMMHKVLNTEPLPPSALSVTVPHSFDSVVRRAMAKRPGDRYASAADFAKALRDALANQNGAPASSGEQDDADATMIADATMVAPSRGADAGPFCPDGRRGPRENRRGGESRGDHDRHRGTGKIRAEHGADRRGGRRCHRHTRRRRVFAAETRQHHHDAKHRDPAATSARPANDHGAARGDTLQHAWRPAMHPAQRHR